MSAVKNSALSLMLAVQVLVLAAAAEELLPKFFGAGIPFLLVSVLFLSMRRTGGVLTLFAIAAGSIEDSISSLPIMTSVSFFLAVAGIVRWCRLSLGAAALIYPLYQVWLGLWVSGLDGNIFHRVLVAVPIGFLTALAAGSVLFWIERKTSVGEQG